ncbi:hypothetical protein N658DRAFT_497757 [Parathielavia hyrcaniae]|uniref:DNA/RNA-binding protein Alba-like domain-containing protein n=1 Tax=Parathielavia hyrcaniae TaxID=113614 RepID=A0AAN6PZL2_9PEZI|nr:hypothetical protein N658DRAFT_497757 [Parathielavia hyrcaniae]
MLQKSFREPGHFDPEPAYVPSDSNTANSMAAQEPLQLPGPNLQCGKRKFLSDSDELALKKRRLSNPPTATQTPSRTPNPTPPASTYSPAYSPLLAKLSPEFEVKAMPVMSSTSISSHVDRALEHLGRFSPWDQTVLPGVVLLCAKSAAAGKLATIAELIRRRIGESDQRWFQYSTLKELALEQASSEPPVVDEPSVVEDTFLPGDRARDEGGDDEYFETRQPTIHERAVQPATVRYMVHMSVLLSRLPLEELKTEPYISLQTNEQRIEHLRKKKMGLLG